MIYELDRWGKTFKLCLEFMLWKRKRGGYNTPFFHILQTVDVFRYGVGVVAEPSLPQTVGGGIERQALEMLSCQPGESLWRERGAPCFTPMHSLRNNRKTRAGCNADRSGGQGRNLYNSVKTWLHHLIATQIRLCEVLLTAN